MNNDDLKEAFMALDNDGDGRITSKELLTAMKNLNIKASKDQVHMMIKMVDHDGNGTIDFGEFSYLMSKNTNIKPNTLSINEEDAKSLFNYFDHDNNGFIDQNELVATMANVGLHITDSDVKDMLKACGSKDGKVYFEHFYQMLKNAPRSTNGPMSYFGSSVSSINTMEIIQAIQMADADPKMRLTIDQIVMALSFLEIKTTNKAVQKAIKKWHLGNAIKLKEFVIIMEELSGDRNIIGPQQIIENNCLKNVFKFVDLNKDGFINAQETRQALEKLQLYLDSPRIKQIMSQVGVGPNGKVSFRDFRSIYHLLTINNSVPPRKRASDSFSMEQKEELQAVFSVFDKDGDGFVTMEEVVMVLQSMRQNPNIELIHNMFKQVDLDDNNMIDFNEFLLLVNKYERPPISELDEIREMFNAMDADGNGSIEINELKESFRRLGLDISDKDVKSMMTTAKIYKDVITFEDFVNIMTGDIGAAQKRFSEPENPEGPILHSTSPADSIVNCIYKDLQEKFQAADIDQDEYLTGTELNQLLIQLEINPTLYSDFVNNVRLKRPGYYDFYEFCEIVTHLKSFISIDEDPSKKHITNPCNNEDNIFSYNYKGDFDSNKIKPSMQIEILNMNDEGNSTNDAGYSNNINKMETVKLAMVKNNLEIADNLNINTKVRPERIHRRPSKESGGQGANSRSNSLTSSNPVPNLPISPTTTWQAFRFFDSNSDGYVSRNELYETMHKLGIPMTSEDLDRTMDSADINKDGRIDYAEFTKLMSGPFRHYANDAAKFQIMKNKSQRSSSSHLSTADMQIAFDGVDIKRRGLLTSSELVVALEKLKINIGTLEAQQLVDEKGNGKGEIGILSFCSIVNSITRTRTTSSSSQSPNRSQGSPQMFSLRDNKYPGSNPQLDGEISLKSKSPIASVTDYYFYLKDTGLTEVKVNESLGQNQLSSNLSYQLCNTGTVNSLKNN